jgi:hypothetical protein
VSLRLSTQDVYALIPAANQGTAHEFRDGWRQITQGPPVMPDLIAEYKARESMTKEDSGLRNWF